MTRAIRTILLTIILSISNSTFAKNTMAPVTPRASDEAIELLEYLYHISGKATLTGQHNAPLNGSNRLIGIHKQTGFYPAIFGQDFGFSAPGTWDGINFRQQIVDEAIRRHAEGFIITIMWHAANPKHDEPVTFEESIQTKLTTDEWRELTTPGTDLHERWKSQVDVIAFFLKQLRDAGVPVLWRPYHEMNGSWFWWGNKPGKDGYNKLYRMLFERFGNVHKLNNLIWVYNANEIKDGVSGYDLFYPGHDVVDILATDFYTTNYNQENYEKLLKLAGNKPIAIGEAGDLPSAEQLARQSRWVWFMSWRDPDYYFWHDQKKIKSLFDSNRTLNLVDLPWIKNKNPNIHYPILK
ncbi:MAG: glycosyl hydrolase family 26 [Gammaproteobacteria bacterium]|nr:glycosyl hydrolase family 26 [Gammaproteobacteria bacterium]